MKSVFKILLNRSNILKNVSYYWRNGSPTEGMDLLVGNYSNLIVSKFELLDI